MWAILGVIRDEVAAPTAFDALAGAREMRLRGLACEAGLRERADSTASGWRLRLPGETMPQPCPTIGPALEPVLGTRAACRSRQGGRPQWVLRRGPLARRAEGRGEPRRRGSRENPGRADAR